MRENEQFDQRKIRRPSHRVKFLLTFTCENELGSSSRLFQMPRIKVLTLIDTLRPAGAERLAVELAIALSGDEEFESMVCVSRTGGELELRLAGAHVECQVLGRGSSFDVAPFTRLLKWIRDARPHLIHAHMPGSNLWGGLLGRVSGVSVVAHVHGESKSLLNAAIRLAVTRLADRIVAVSEHERQNLLQLPGVEPRRVVTIHNGIEMPPDAGDPAASVRQELGFPADSQIVGICAQLRGEKAHEIYLRAARKIADACPGARFVIVGDGERRAPLEQLARELGLVSLCVFTGQRRDVPRLLRAFDVAVLASSREGLPLAILEYMACGLPVVATRVGGVGEAVRDGENGFLVEAGDWSGLGDRVIQLLRDATLRKEFGVGAKRSFSEEFTQAAMVEKVKELYRQVVREVRLGGTRR